MREQLVNQAIIAAVAQREEIDQYIEGLRALAVNNTPTTADEIVETTLKRRGRPATKASPAKSGQKKGRTWSAQQKSDDRKRRAAKRLAKKEAIPVAAAPAEKPKRQGRPTGSKNKPKAPVLPEQMPSPVFEGDELDQRSHEEVNA